MRDPKEATIGLLCTFVLPWRITLPHPLVGRRYRGRGSSTIHNPSSPQRQMHVLHSRPSRQPLLLVITPAAPNLPAPYADEGRSWLWGRGNGARARALIGPPSLPFPPLGLPLHRDVCHRDVADAAHHAERREIA